MVEDTPGRRPADRADRFWARTAERRDVKSAFGTDCDRIMYATSFRRLGGVTQVLSPGERALYHNRLTHSLKVAQVGIRIAHRVRELADGDAAVARAVERFGGMDSRVVRAACLAHDLGHPPFGHIGERELQRLLDPQTAVEKARALAPAFHLPRDSFEGNAQSFRIVTRLAFRERNPEGGPSTALDLTRATLRALLKYPWTKDESLALEDENLKRKRQHKWGAYGSEQELLEWARGDGQGRPADFYGVQRVEYRSMEAQAMDWADDISYAVHDVEDFFRAGYIPLHVLRNSTVERDTFFEAAWERISDQIGHAITKEEARRQLLDMCGRLLPDQDYRGTQDDREGLHAFAGELIERSVEGLRVTDGGVLRPGLAQLTLIELLKEMTWYYVIKRPTLSSVQRGQAALLRELTRGMVDWVTEEERDLEEIATGRAVFNERRFPARLLAYLRTAFAVGDQHGIASYTPEQKVSRAVTDYVVSLTEAQAIMLNSRLTGRTEEAMLDSWD